MKAYKNATIEVLKLEEDIVRTSDGSSGISNDNDNIVNADEFH